MIEFKIDGYDDPDWLGPKILVPDYTVCMMLNEHDNNNLPDRVIKSKDIKSLVTRMRMLKKGYVAGDGEIISYEVLITFFSRCLPYEHDIKMKKLNRRR